ncbi:MAG TPA: HAMP domain-containing sensor histidine kinase [Pseudonocardia sp.]|jgi:signal transduction histidine kinase|uniref:sensor histidine kinase n=1 Tax=Pseudonocardia sp. TaxID=60912 RepID=UPI002B4B1E75|nr:HAMP domain-containing sensor histidine kinase [Pseudonocardia sp.]HLU60405.1 HAMP domain-containing sensor histidine kinase [Pseudonocardia sp.]
MAARLLVIVLFLVGLLAAGLGVPLALSYAQARQLAMFTDRLTDTIFYASVAERPITQADTTGLAAELERYDEVYGVAVMVLDEDGRLVATSRQPPPVLDADAQERVKLALANRRSEVYPLLLPWDERPLVLAEPVLVDTEVRGVAVTISPTDTLRAEELRVWSLVVAAGLAALAMGVVVALPIVRWILRPVRRLDEGTGRVAAAVLAGADPEPVADGTGPPELRQLSVSFDRMTATVAQAYAAQRAFVADASHQLRNPLTALRLRLSNLDGHVDEVAAEDHAAALEEAERLSTLLDGLLALARAERTAPPVVADVDEGVEDRLDAWRPLAEHMDLELVRTGIRGLQVRAPEGAIETVLDAVLDNAVKFAPPGTPISVSTDAVDGRVEIAVRDRGPGMAPEELERATGRFWRSPAQSNTEGSGLGLAIAARTLEVAGGELVLELPPGGGLRVVARFPRPTEEDGAAEDAERRDETPTAPR